VPKCEIFHPLHFHDFYTIKSFWVGDFEAKSAFIKYQPWGGGLRHYILGQ
jgi:hypothetical protein